MGDHRHMPLSRLQSLGVSLFDGFLEQTVGASWSSVGFDVRRRLFGWTPAPDDALDGRTVLVTGPTSGIGRAVSDELAALGARVILVGRDAERLAKVRDELLNQHGEDRFPTVVADMSSLRSIESAASLILQTEARLDIIIDNAGAIFHAREESPDGIECTLATLVVGPFALISRMLPLLERSRAARVVAVTSGGMYTQGSDPDDLETTPDPFDGTRAYARAKRVQVSLAREWARRLGATGITFNAMHPGWTDTPGLAEALPWFHQLMGPILRTPAQGVDTLVWLAAAPEAGHLSGKLFLDRRPRPFDRVPWTRVSALDRRRLWDRVVALAGVPDPSSEH